MPWRMSNSARSRMSASRASRWRVAAIEARALRSAWAP